MKNGLRGARLNGSIVRAPASCVIYSYNFLKVSGVEA